MGGARLFSFLSKLGGENFAPGYPADSAKAQ